MRKTLLFITVQLLTLICLTACGNTIDSQSKEDTLPQSVVTVDETKASLRMEEAPSQVQKQIEIQTFAPEDFEEQLTKPLRNSKLPDLYGKALGKKNDEKSDGKYYIDALKLDLQLPEGYYLYRLDGMYLTDTGRKLSLEFVDEYVLALRDIPEKDLQVAIYQYNYKNDPQAVPPWILWSFKIVHKDYFPIEQLFSSRIPMSGEVRQCGEYLVISGTTRPWYTDTPQMEGYYVDPYSTEYQTTVEEHSIAGDTPSGRIYDWESIGEAMDTAYDWPLRIRAEEWFTDRLMERILSASKSNGTFYQYLQPVFINGDTWDKPLLFYNKRIPFWPDGDSAITTILNDSWWANYQNAVKELTEKPEKYAVSSIPISITVDTPGEWEPMTARDTYLRAFVYACVKSVNQGIALEDLVLYTKPSGNDIPFFLAFVLDRENNWRLTPLLKGIGYVLFCDLTVAKEYLNSVISY